MRVLKGHGTENDFVVLPDLDGRIGLTGELTRALCDRHAGIGADGVLRVVRTVHVPEAAAMADDATFFMDYRNADGSLAEMCGNGVRVFLRYLQRMCLVEQDAAVATRGGIVRVRSMVDGNVDVHMGLPQILADRPVVTAAHSRPVPALGVVHLPNPHVVVDVGTREALAELELSRAPSVVPELPDGQNVEFVALVGERHLAMRVHERGSGETRSCGTGICAAVVAMAAHLGSSADAQRWQVDVPGGTCHVVWSADGITLSGPAVIVAEVEVEDAWLAELARA